MINHSNIYAHRRFGSRLGKSKLSISSASSMISLAPMDEEDILNYSLKNNDSTKEDDLDFNFDDQDELIPEVMYQNNCKKRKDNVYTAGKWTEEGLARYNEFIGIVQKRRLNAQVFEERLKARMIGAISSESMRKKRKRRQRVVEKTAEPKKKVIITNILNLTEV